MIDHRTALIDYLKEQRQIVVGRMIRVHSRIASAMVARMPVDDLEALAASYGRYIDKLTDAIATIEKERDSHSKLRTPTGLPGMPAGEGDLEDGARHGALPTVLHRPGKDPH